VSASLETPRLRLRRLVPADEADLIALDSDPDVMRHVGSPAGVKSTGPWLSPGIAAPPMTLSFEARLTLGHLAAVMLIWPARR
jgi:RimJ/RimL family protein N-acetyltransferase